MHAAGWKRDVGQAETMERKKDLENERAGCERVFSSQKK